MDAQVSDLLPICGPIFVNQAYHENCEDACAHHSSFTRTVFTNGLHSSLSGLRISKHLFWKECLEPITIHFCKIALRLAWATSN